MSIKFGNCRKNLILAWTMVEMMVAVGVFSICGAAISTIFVFSIRSFAALSNYASLDKENRETMDKITQELRQARQVTDYSSTNGANTLTLINGEGEQVSYSFSANTKQMIRQAQGGYTQVLLTNCDLLSFSLFMRPPTNAGFNAYFPATGNWTNSVKMVQLTWKTSMTLPNARVTSENVQTARVVIRKQQE